MIKATLIDLDGTILDSMGMWETLGMNILNSLGFTTEEDINELFKSFTIRQAAEYYHNHFLTNLTIEEMENIINKTIEEAYLYNLPLKEGVKDFLKNLKENNISIALVTATNSFLSMKALERLHVLDYFDLILSCDDLNCSKNDSTIYDKALDKLNVSKSEALVFEDALHAINAAIENGYKTVGVYDKYVVEQDEIKEICDYYLKNFSNSDELINHIQKENI